MKFINKYLVLLVAIVAFSCEQDEILAPTNYVTFQDTARSVDLDVDASVTDSFNVFTGGKTGSDRTFDLVVDESSTIPAGNLTAPSQVVIPANENQATIEYTVNYSDAIDITGGSVVFRLVGSTDNILGTSTLNVTVGITCDLPVSIEINFDDYAGETSWEIVDGNGTVFYSGDDYAGGTFTRDVCLPMGTYDFIIYDAFGDGICCSYGNGSYSVSYDGQVLGSGGDFGASETTTIVIE